MTATTSTRPQRVRRISAAFAVLGAASAIAAVPASPATGAPLTLMRVDQSASATVPSWGDADTAVRFLLREADQQAQDNLRTLAATVQGINQARKADRVT